MEEVRVVATGMSKSLKFSSLEKPKWPDLPIPSKVKQYLNHLQDSGMCGVDGQLTKLQHFEKGIKYIKLELSTDDDQATYQRCQKAADCYTEWRGSFQREKALLS